jgi:hypothetical protein
MMCFASVPTNSEQSDAAQTLLAEAKGAIAAGDRARALRVLDGLRYRPAADSRELPPAIAEALVATATGDRDHVAVPVAQPLDDAHVALTQILDWIDSLAFDVNELAEIVAAASRRQSAPDRIDGAPDRIDGAPDEALSTNEGDMRALPFGSGWLEWRWVAKPSGRKFGPYVYYRWREGGRKRTKYVGKAAR